MKKIAILGSTGSIGTQTLEIVRDNPDLQVMGLAAGSNAALMEKQIREFHPALAVMWSEEAAEELRGRTTDLPVKVLSGMEGLLAFMGMGGINKAAFLAMYASGFPMNVIHGSATVIFLAVLGEPMLAKLERIRKKYGILEP